MITPELNQQAIELIKKSKNVLLVPSSPVDADCLGSAISLYLVIKKLGGKATVVCTDPIPNTYKFLPSVSIVQNEFSFVKDFVITVDCRNLTIENVKHEIHPEKINIVITPKDGKLSEHLVSFSEGGANFDLIISVDAGGIDQFRAIYDANLDLFKSIPFINIDHHVSNPSFGTVNLLDFKSSSTTMIVMDLIEKMDANLMDADIATLLLAGLITDTGSFQNPNTTPDAFAYSAHLIEKGARQQEIIQYLYRTKPLSQLKLWGRILSKIQFDEGNRLVWSTITKEDLAETGSTSDMSEGLIDELMSNAPGSEIIFLLKDKGEGVISGSVRTTDAKIPASQVAEKFGGGGHMQAAGFKVTGKTIQEVEQWVVTTLREFQKGRLG